MMKISLLIGLLLLWPMIASAQTDTHKQKQIILDVLSQGATWADMISTQKALRPSIRFVNGVEIVSPPFKEADPLAKPFTSLPAPAYDIAGTSLSFGLSVLGRKMHHSNRWFRHIWWVPQVAQITINTTCAVHNSILLTKRP